MVAYEPEDLGKLSQLKIYYYIQGKAQEPQGSKALKLPRNPEDPRQVFYLNCNIYFIF